MKLTLVCLALVIACVSAENCFRDSQCNLETCSGTGWTVNCHSGVCTCDHTTHTGNSCSSQADCSGQNCGNFQFLSGHCIDGHCRCAPGSGGK